MNIKEIIEDWLEKNGYQGLVGDYGCGCALEDFMPCGEVSEDCEAAYKIKCKGKICPSLEICEAGISKYCLTAKKPKDESEIIKTKAKQEKKK